MEEAVQEVNLLGKQLFDHKPVLRPTIERLVDAFERNGRHKEFDGILRASHSLVEAASTASERLLSDGRLESTTQRVNALAARLEKLTTPTYQKEHDAYLASIRSEQDNYVSLCEAEAMRKMRLAAGVPEVEEHAT